MAFTVLTAVASLCMLVGYSASNAQTNDSAITTYAMHGSHSSHPSPTSVGHEQHQDTTTPVPSSESSPVNNAGKEDGSDDEMAAMATQFRYSVLGMSHKLREEKDIELMEKEPDVQSTVSNVSQRPVETYQFGSAALLNRSSGLYLTPLYQLYALASLVAADGKPASESHEFATDHLNTSYSLHSSVTNVTHDDNTDALKTGHSKATLVSQSSALPREKQVDGKLIDKSSDSSDWTYYTIIALCVLAAVVVILVVAICMIRYCRRSKIYCIPTKPVVRGVGSPTS